MFDQFLDLFFPRTLSKELLAANVVWHQIPVELHREEKQSLRARGLTKLDSLSSAVDYQRCPLIRDAMSAFKYQHLTSLAHRLSDFLLDVSTLNFDENAVLCPVPLHWIRQFDRGFNQSELLAQSIAGALELPIASLLKRVRDTGHQAWRNRKERLRSLHGAFFIRSDQSIPHHVVLIDDISTTGATLDACAHALKDEGVQRVDAWVIARG